MTDWDRALSFVLCLEGGYVDDADDAGGATNMGITQATLDRVATRGAFGGGRRARPPQPVDDHAFAHVAQRPLDQQRRAAVLHRRVEDGQAGGPDDAAAAVAVPVKSPVDRRGFVPRQVPHVGRRRDAARRGAVQRRLRYAHVGRAAYYGRIVRNRPSQEKFRRGWFNRLRRLAREAGVRPPA